MSQYDSCPSKGRDILRENTTCLKRQRLEQSSCTLRRPRIAGHHLKLGRGKRKFYPESQKKQHSPADALILHI